MPIVEKKNHNHKAQCILYNKNFPKVTLPFKYSIVIRIIIKSR